MSYNRLYAVVKKKISGMGVKNSLIFIIKRAYNRIFFSKNLFVIVDLNNYDPDEEHINKEIEVIEKESFGQLTQREKESLREYGGKALLEIFAKRLEKGYRLFLAYIKGEVVGGSWVYEGGEKKFYTIPLLEKDCASIGTFTIDKFRQKGGATALVIKVLLKIKEAGFQRVVASIKEWNYPVQKVCDNVGFEFIGKYREFRLFNRNILIWYSFRKEGFL